jgi:uncharacterized protein (DUF433 family)
MLTDLHPRFADKALSPRYTFPEAGTILGQPAQKLRRWSLGHERTYNDRPMRDEPLIYVDGSAEPGAVPLSFLNLIELRFLSSYRAGASLPAIRRALDYAAVQLNLARPLLQQEFAIHGKELFMEYAAGDGDRYFVNASRGGQLAWTPTLDFFLQSLEYDSQEHAAYQWWPLGKARPVVVDTRLNGGRPSTASSGLRADIINLRLAQGWDQQSLAEDLAAQPDEIAAAIEFAEAA